MIASARSLMGQTLETHIKSPNDMIYGSGLVDNIYSIGWPRVGETGAVFEFAPPSDYDGSPKGTAPERKAPSSAAFRAGETRLYVFVIAMMVCRLILS